MNRDIEFRGISTRTGNLVYGNYFHNFRKGESHNIIPFDTNEWIEVVPETIGQYTGLKDKNGIKIFEGDIINDDGFIDLVNFGEFYSTKSNCVGFYWKSDFTNFGKSLSNSFLVIGNIYQHKNLYIN